MQALQGLKGLLLLLLLLSKLALLVLVSWLVDVALVPLGLARCLHRCRRMAPVLQGQQRAAAVLLALLARGQHMLLCAPAAAPAGQGCQALLLVPLLARACPCRQACACHAAVHCLSRHPALVQEVPARHLHLQYLVPEATCC